VRANAGFLDGRGNDGDPAKPHQSGWRDRLGSWSNHRAVSCASSCGGT